MKKLLMTSLALVLAACGGGGSDTPVGVAPTPKPVVATAAAGFWEGAASTGLSFSWLFWKTGKLGVSIHRAIKLPVRCMALLLPVALLFPAREKTSMLQQDQ